MADEAHVSLMDAALTFMTTLFITSVVGVMVMFKIVSARGNPGGGDGQFIAMMLGGVVGTVVGIVCGIAAFIKQRSIGWSIMWSAIITSVLCLVVSSSIM